MYVIREKGTQKILVQNPAPLSQEMGGIDLDPHFDEQTMEVLRYDGEELPEHYRIEKGGNIVALSFKEKVQQGLIEFSEDLMEHVPPAEDDPAPPKLQQVKIGLKAKIIKTVEQCQIAFRLLDEEFENRVAEQYAPGEEIKILKGLVDWLYEDRPKNDQREQKYLAMKKAVEALKEEYKPVRAELKKIMLSLKARSTRSKKPNS